MDENKIFKRSDQVVSREIEGEVVLLPLYKSSKDLNYIYTLNKTAATAWGLIDGKNNLADIKNKLTDEFNVEETKLTKQLNELIKDLTSIRAIV